MFSLGSLSGDTDPDALSSYFSNVTEPVGGNQRLNTSIPNFGPGFVFDGGSVDLASTFPHLGTTDINGNPLQTASSVGATAESVRSATTVNTGTDFDSDTARTGTTTQSDGVFSRAAGKKGVSAAIAQDIQNQFQGGGTIELQPLTRSNPNDVVREDPTSTYDGDSFITTESSQVPASPFGATEHGEWRGSLGGIDVAELPDLPGDSPFLLSDLPDPTIGEFNMSDSVDWTSMSAEAKEAMSDYLSSDVARDNAFLSAEGIGQEAGLFSRTGFTNFVEARLQDVAIGSLLMPYFQWLDHATGNPWVSRGIQGAMAVAGLVMTGDPFGVIAAPICWGIEELQKQDRRKLENDNPDSNYGKRYGFVREGNKWYPAYLTRAERDEGWLGSDRTQIRMSYGKEIKFKREKGTGKMIPYFDEGTYRQKDFHVWDNEVDTENEQSTKAWRDQADPLRDFYFLSADETNEFLKNIAGGDTLYKYSNDRDHTFTKEEQEEMKNAQKKGFQMMQVHDDVNWEQTWEQYGTDEQKDYYKQYNLYVDTMQDIRRGLELFKDYRTSEPGSLYTKNQDENEYSGAKAFRRVLNDSGYLGYQGELKGQMHRLAGSTPSEMLANARSLGTGKKHNFEKMPEEGKWLIGEWSRAMSALYESQRRAGNAMHFDKVFTNPDDIKEGAPAWMTNNDEHSLQQNAWRLYTDSTWEIGDVSSDEGLRDALRTIEASSDSSLVGTHDYRNADQRDYLANKAYVRYLNAKIQSLGLTEAQQYWTNVLGHSKEGGRQAIRKMQLGDHIDFGFTPEYSFADDYEKWGYHTKVTQIGDEEVDYLAPDYKLPEDKKHYYTAEPEWLSQFKQFYSGDQEPGMISGRFTSKDDYESAVNHLSQNDGTQLEIETESTWDPWGEGVPDNEMPWDDAQGEYVKPSDKTPGSVYDPLTNTYKHENHKDPAVKIHTEGTLPVIHENSSDFFNFGAFVPEQGIDYPDGFFWNASEQKVVSPDGISYDLGDHSMWDDYYNIIDPPETVDDVSPDVQEPDPVIVPEEPEKTDVVHDNIPIEPMQPVHVNEELPIYMQQPHEDLVFTHTDAPVQLPSTKTI